MKWYQKVLNIFSMKKVPSIVPNTGIRVQGKIVDDAEYEATMSHNARRILQCNKQIEKWTNRIKSGIYPDIGLSQMKEKIKSIKSTRTEFEKLTNRDRRK